MSCPICDQPLQEVYRDVVAGHLAELHEVCPFGHYELKFAYGASRERIGSWEQITSYTDDEATSTEKRKERQAWMETVKKLWTPKRKKETE